jgi:hypothetical protein
LRGPPAAVAHHFPLSRRAPSSSMTWPDQNPPASDVILHVNVPCAGGGSDKLTYLEIDKLPDGTYRATVGTLFEHQEICRTGDLEALVRQANVMAAQNVRPRCRSRCRDIVDGDERKGGAGVFQSRGGSRLPREQPPKQGRAGDRRAPRPAG